MNFRFLTKTSLALLLLLTTASFARAQQKEPPREWIDPDTGHRVIRLSNEPGSASLYFHQNAYTPERHHNRKKDRQRLLRQESCGICNGPQEQSH